MPDPVGRVVPAVLVATLLRQDAAAIGLVRELRRRELAARALRRSRPLEAARIAVGTEERR